MAEGWIIRNTGQLEAFVQRYRDSWDWSKPLYVEPKEHKPKRSLDANALFHIWCREAEKFFKIKPREGLEPGETMKLVFKNMFLGYEDIVLTDNTTIKGQLRRTSKLDSGEMCHFMDLVVAWCADKGCPLSHPRGSEYEKWKEAG